MTNKPESDGREPWELSREEYLEFLQTLEPQAWFDQVVDWGSVEQLSFDMMEQRLILEYELHKHEPPHVHKVVFEGVRAAFFESGRDGILIAPNTAKNGKGWEGAAFRPEGLFRVTMEPLELVTPIAKNHKTPESITNFILEFHVFHQTLNIEASRIIIDGRIFDVGLPTPWHLP